MALSLNTRGACGGQNQKTLIRSAGKNFCLKRIKERGQGKTCTFSVFTLKFYYSIVISVKYELYRKAFLCGYFYEIHKSSRKNLSCQL